MPDGVDCHETLTFVVRLWCEMEAEGHEQMDYAVGQGVNFFDTAELYPTTPNSADTWGDTETIIGTWFAGRTIDSLTVAGAVDWDRASG